MVAGLAPRSAAEAASCRAACLDVAHTGVDPPRDPHSPLLPHAKGAEHSLSGVRHFSFDDGASSHEARHGVAGKSGRSQRCISALLSSYGATDCDHGSANWRSRVSSFTPFVERGVGKFALVWIIRVI